MKKLPRKRSFNFADNYLPWEHRLSERLVGQELASQTLASLMSAYQNRKHLERPPLGPRILCIGPSSSGKTFAAEIVSEEMNLPTVTVNCGGLVPNAYKGTDISSAMRSLFNDEGPCGVERIESGNMIILDEIDKIPIRSKLDGFLEQIQYSLLPILNGDPLLVDAAEGSDEPPAKLTTKNSFVIMAGVFSGVPRSAWKTIPSAQKALVRFGFCEEFVSRITHIVQFEKLKQKEVEVLVKREEDSLAALFQSGNLRPSLTPQQRKTVVNFVGASPLGIRGSRTLIYEYLQKDACESAVESFGL